MPLFMKFDQLSRVLKISPKSKGQVGRYPLMVTVAGVEYGILVVEVVRQVSISATNGETVITGPISNGQGGNQTKGQKQQKAEHPLTMKIKNIGMDGSVVLSFNSKVLIPVNYQNFSQNEELEIFVIDNATSIKSWKLTDFSE